MAVRIAAGLNVPQTRKRTNLSALRRRARAGRKQGRKRGLDAMEMCAPDSVRAKCTKVSQINSCYTQRGLGYPLPPVLLACLFTSSSFALYYFFPFSFAHSLYFLFSSNVHLIPFYHNTSTPFPGVRSYEATEPGFNLLCL